MILDLLVVFWFSLATENKSTIVPFISSGNLHCDQHPSNFFKSQNLEPKPTSPKPESFRICKHEFSLIWGWEEVWLHLIWVHEVYPLALWALFPALNLNYEEILNGAREMGKEIHYYAHIASKSFFTGLF